MAAKLLVSSAGKLLVSNGKLAQKDCCCAHFPPFLLYQYEVTNGSLAWFDPFTSAGFFDPPFCFFERHYLDPPGGTPTQHWETQNDCARRYASYRKHRKLYSFSPDPAPDGTFSLICESTTGGDANAMQFRRWTNFDTSCDHGSLSDCIVQDFDITNIPDDCGEITADYEQYDETVSNEYTDDQFVGDRDGFVDLSLLAPDAPLATLKWVFQPAAWTTGYQFQQSFPQMVANNYHIFRGRYTSRQDGYWRILFPPVDYIKLWIRTFTRTYTLTDDGIGNGEDPCACGDVVYSPCAEDRPGCTPGEFERSVGCAFVDTIIETGKRSAPALVGSGAYMATNYGFGDPATAPDWHWLDYHLETPELTPIVMNQEIHLWLMKYSTKRGETPDDPPIADCEGVDLIGIPDEH